MHMSPVHIRGIKHLTQWNLTALLISCVTGL
jgi:hypothetical protein